MTSVESHNNYDLPAKSLARSTEFPAAAGMTPPLNRSGPSPVEMETPQGTKYHPATPIPEHRTPTQEAAEALLLPTMTNIPFGSPATPAFCGFTPAPTPASTPVHPSTLQFSPSPVVMNFATETYETSEHLPASALPVQPSTIKGNFTSLVGKITHNPEKQMAGNAMIACRQEEKANFFDQRAEEWEQKGNLAKAQKNREKVCSAPHKSVKQSIYNIAKAIRYRQKAQAKLHEPITAPVNKKAIKTDKVAKLDAKALECEKKGDLEGSLKCKHKV